MRKYGESKMTRIMMATVPHVNAWVGRTKYQADGFLLDEVYIVLVGMGLLSSLEGGCRHFFCTRMNYADVLVLWNMVSFLNNRLMIVVTTLQDVPNTYGSTHSGQKM